MAKAQPGRILYASASVGSGSHLFTEMFKAQTGIDMLHIPYKGSGPAVTDLIGGQVSLMFSTASSVHTQVVAGKLRAVAITSAKRHVTLPNVPTVADTLPGFEISQWIAMHAPRATPRDIVERLNGAVVAITQAQAYRERMAAQGYDAESSTPQQLAARVKSELARFGKLIKAIGLKDGD
jgi:tripartite-type tricarboxylate transporter receptor subunit TctC